MCCLPEHNSDRAVVGLKETGLCMRFFFSFFEVLTARSVAVPFRPNDIYFSFGIVTRALDIIVKA